MHLVKWDPFRELEGLQARLNRLFGDTPLRGTEDETPFFTDWAPPVDIQETDNDYMLKADLPEVTKEDVKVAFEDGILTVEGERQREKEEVGKKFHRVERAHGRFIRRFALPTEIDVANAHAEFKEGVLTIRLPKTAVAKPKAFEVKVA